MIEDVFENLVGQFSDPFTFLRELIQNAMDAGSETVDVTVSYMPDFGGVEVIVADSGEGMDLDIINERLTQLFSSTKEDDYTKIGKFGIGFVSVFALNPELVLVDTGRGGEFWRVAFNGTTSFRLLTLEQPVEGTQVKVYKKLAQEELEKFTRRAYDTIRFWCRYSETEVTFNGEPINESLRVESSCQVRVEKPGSILVCGLSGTQVSKFGYYNQGLTLMEGDQEELVGITYKIKSRYLEHTLTRDNVIHDDNYFKVMKILKQTAEGELVDYWVENFVASLDSEEKPGDPETFEELLSLAQPLFRDWKNRLPESFHDRPVFPTLHGGLYPLRAILDAGKEEEGLFIHPVGNYVTRELASRGIPVFKGVAGGSLATTLSVLSGKPVRDATLSVALPLPVQAPAEFSAIAPRLIGMLRRGGESVLRVQLANFNYEGSSVGERVCLTQKHPGEPIRLYQRGFWKDLQKFPGALLYNRDHPLVKKAIHRVKENPRLAAFTLAKAALLDDGLSQRLEAGLVAKALKVKS